MKLPHLLIITSTLLLGAGTALAANPGDQAAINTSPLRRACPEIDETLQDALQSRAYRLANEKWIKVQFTLNGNQITAVKQQGGSEASQAQVSDALKQLACRSEQGQQQQLEFKLHLSKY